MYPSLRGTPEMGVDATKGGPTEGGPTKGLPTDSTRVGGTVLALGTVSLLTDISSEMVAAVLPIYLTVALGLSPLAFGVVDGVYQGATVFLRLAGGYVSDRLGRAKAVCQVGYGVSAASKLGLIAAGGQIGAVTLVVAVDRGGKGIRTAPRDALIAGSVHPSILGRAFGVHRAMDTAGAMAGPLLAFGLLLLLPGDYNSLFLTSFVIAVLGCLVLWAFVRESPTAPGQPTSRLGDVLRLLRRPAFGRLALASGGLALFSVSDGFLYLTLRDLGAVRLAYFPLLFLGTAGVYLALAVPLGRLADRQGRTRVLIGGHVALLGSYLLLLAGSSLPGPLLLAGVVGLLGLYYAATDGVLPAIAAALSPSGVRGSGIAVVQTAVAGGRLLSAVLFGLVWTVFSQQLALAGFAIALAAGLPLAARSLRLCDRIDSAEGTGDA